MPIITTADLEVLLSIEEETDREMETRETECFYGRRNRAIKNKNRADLGKRPRR